MVYGFTKQFNGHIMVYSDVAKGNRGEPFEENHKSIKILLTSGYADDLMRRTTQTAKGVTLLRKPYHQAELAETLRDILDG